MLEQSLVTHSWLIFHVFITLGVLITLFFLFHLVVALKCTSGIDEYDEGEVGDEEGDSVNGGIFSLVVR